MSPGNAPPQGSIEPHALMLRLPTPGQRLYKIVSVKNLLSSISGGYLHFNRVDQYNDLDNADQNDGEQLPKDRASNEMSSFEQSPTFTAAKYYDQSRSRTYACCFSLENSKYIWKHYGNGDKHGKVCIVFDFEKLRKRLNHTLSHDSTKLIYDDLNCHQIFSINYGIVQYVNRHEHQLNQIHLENPIAYTYIKDRESFSQEKEFRVSLSTIGLGRFILNSGTEMNLPSSLQLEFNFRQALNDATITELQIGPDCDQAFLNNELRKYRICAQIVSA